MFYLKPTDYHPPYSVLDNSDLPFLFLGFFIKSEFDTDIEIPAKYKPFRFKHFAKINQDIYEEGYYYGIKIYNTQKIDKLIKDLNKSTINNEIITLGIYKNLISSYNLSCDECYKNFRIGSFPLDIKHLYKFVGEDFKNLVEDFYNLKNKLNIAGLHLNILTANPRLTSCNLKKLPFN